MIENKYVKVKGIDNLEIVELPLELDNTLSFAVLSSQFPYSTGLKYRNSKNNQIRTVRRTDGKFFLSPDLNWDDFIFFCCCPQSKRKILENPKDKFLIQKKPETLKSIFRKFPDTFDLMAIGLSYDTTENNFADYLTRFGKLMYCKLKSDEVFGYSRGVAYFRFSGIKSQNICLSATHVVDKTKIMIRIPNEKINIKESKSSKLYVSNVCNTLTREDIRAYFHQFGHVIHVFMPPDKRNFAFVTFLHDKSIELVMKEGQTHCFNGARVNVYRVMEKDEITNINNPLLLNHKDSCRKRKQATDNQDNNLHQATISKLNQNVHYINSPQFSENSFPSSQIKSSSYAHTYCQPSPIAFSYNFPPPPFSIPSKSVSHTTQYLQAYTDQSVPSQKIQNLSPALYNSHISNQPSPSSIQPVNYQGLHTNVNREIFSPEIKHPKPDSFQSLVIKEIISNFLQKNSQQFQSFQQSEKCISQLAEKISADKSVLNFNQWENLVNNVRVLHKRSSQLKNEENSIETLFQLKSQLKFKPNNCDLSVINDPKIHTALKVLKDSKVLDLLLQLSQTEREKCIANT